MRDFLQNRPIKCCGGTEREEDRVERQAVELMSFVRRFWVDEVERRGRQREEAVPAWQFPTNAISAQDLRPVLTSSTVH